MFNLAQVSPPAEVDAAGRRVRKQQQMRLAIERAALDLFATKGYEATTIDDITELADVSKSTFFRYFASKGEVIFTPGEEHFLGLRAAITARPAEEPDLTAIMRAVEQRWVPDIDGEWVDQQRRAAATSAVLRGQSFDLGLDWQAAITTALAERRGDTEPAAEDWVVAGLALAIVSTAMNRWLDEGRPGDLGSAIDDAYRTGTAAFAYAAAPQSDR